MIERPGHRKRQDGQQLDWKVAGRDERKNRIESNSKNDSKAEEENQIEKKVSKLTQAEHELGPERRAAGGCFARGIAVQASHSSSES